MRILLIRPCCIGDVVMATAALTSVRVAYPDAHITMAVGGWSQQAIQYHPALDDILDTGTSAMPVKSVSGFWRFVRQMRSGHYDIVISFVRSPLMSLAVGFSGISTRAGINSNGRGFGYTHRYDVNPDERQHEAEIYLQVVAQLGIKTADFRINLPVLPQAKISLQKRLNDLSVTQPYLVINPTGGSNPGMVLDSKRWLPQNFAFVANALAKTYHAQVILLGSASDQVILDAVQAHLEHPAIEFAGVLSFPEIGALSADALLYLGNDTGLTHLAAASGAKTAMIMGISDPRRYAPFTDDSLVLWKPTDIVDGGVAHANNTSWDWERDGISADDALAQLQDFLL